jgi:hypothetical protein
MKTSSVISVVSTVLLIIVEVALLPCVLLICAIVVRDPTMNPNIIGVVFFAPYSGVRSLAPTLHE